MIECILEVREVEKGSIIFISIFKIRVSELSEKSLNNNCNTPDFFVENENFKNYCEKFKSKENGINPPVYIIQLQ